MSFVLPRNIPKLTFTGSVRALGTKRPKSAPPPLPPRARRSDRDVYQAEDIPTPYLGSRPHMEAARPRLDSSGDDVATIAMSRAIVEGALPTPPRPVLPAFNIRSAAAAAGPALVVPPGSRKARAGRSPMMTVFWLLAAVLAAMISYRYAPELLERVGDAVKLL